MLSPFTVIIIIYLTFLRLLLWQVFILLSSFAHLTIVDFIIYPNSGIISFGGLVFTIKILKPDYLVNHNLFIFPSKSLLANQIEYVVTFFF